MDRGDIELAVLRVGSLDTGDGETLELPMEWQVTLPGLQHQWQIKPLYDAQWMGGSYPYWEGVVQVFDQHGEDAGVGYMELTGYE